MRNVTVSGLSSVETHTTLVTKSGEASNSSARMVVMTALGIDGFTRMVATLVAALPSAGWVFIFAIRYEADAGRISAAILWTTALAFASFSALVWLFGVGTTTG